MSEFHSTGLACCTALLGACKLDQASETFTRSSTTTTGKTSDNADSPSSSRIPPELWIQVFSYATHIPGAYTHTDQQAFYAFTMDTHGISVHRRHRETTDTMLAATRVCKKWAPIALDFLFKYLLIKSGDHAVEIATALEQQASRARAGACVGGRTVRLELALDGVHVWNEAHTLAFERIVAACSNITVLSTAFSTGSGPLVHTAALAHALELSELPSTLRRLELSGNGIVFDSILPRFSRSLDALWIRPTGHTELAKTTSGPVEFPRLLSLAVTAHRAVIPPKDWTMPRLLTLRMDSDLLSYLMGQTVQSFLEAQGPMLRILDVTRCPRMNLRFCPNLVDCTVPMSLLETLFANVPVPLSLRRLTFDRICEVRAAWIEPRSVMRFSLSMREEHEAGRLPPLESIRFLLPIAKRTMEPLQGTACLEIPYWECAVAELRQACGSLKIALETSIGADEHTANVWRPLSYEHFLGA